MTNILKLEKLPSRLRHVFVHFPWTKPPRGCTHKSMSVGETPEWGFQGGEFDSQGAVCRIKLGTQPRYTVTPFMTYMTKSL